jgi:epsilon-lactone hydrolase
VGFVAAGLAVFQGMTMAGAVVRSVYVPTGGTRKASGFTLRGRGSYRRRSVWLLMKVTLGVTARRMMGRRLVKGWSWNFECANLFMQEQMKAAFGYATMAEAREFLEALAFNPVDDTAVTVSAVKAGGPRGSWFVPRNPAAGRMMLYFHGGGYAFYARSHGPMISLMADAAGARTVAPDYRLAPEHPHPAQLEDAVAAYRWLLEEGADPRRLVVAGDSAGGHLTLMLLIELRKLGLPQPALAVGICPWTDVGKRGASLFGNERYDWIQGEMALKFGEWYRGPGGPPVEALSPVSADLRGLAPMYIQAGGREILHDMIQDFVAAAKGQGAAVALDVWEDMTHDFQAYGSYLPESAEALGRLREEVGRRCAG